MLASGSWWFRWLETTDSPSENWSAGHHWTGRDKKLTGAGEAEADPGDQSGRGGVTCGERTVPRI